MSLGLYGSVYTSGSDELDRLREQLLAACSSEILLQPEPSEEAEGEPEPPLSERLAQLEMHLDEAVMTLEVLERPRFSPERESCYGSPPPPKPRSPPASRRSHRSSRSAPRSKAISLRQPEDTDRTTGTSYRTDTSVLNEYGTTHCSIKPRVPAFAKLRSGKLQTSPSKPPKFENVASPALLASPAGAARLAASANTSAGSNVSSGSKAPSADPGATNRSLMQGAAGAGIIHLQPRDGVPPLPSLIFTSGGAWTDPHAPSPTFRLDSADRGAQSASSGSYYWDQYPHNRFPLASTLNLVRRQPPALFFLFAVVHRSRPSSFFSRVRRRRSTLLSSHRSPALPVHRWRRPRPSATRLSAPTGRRRRRWRGARRCCARRAPAPRTCWR